MTSIREFKNCRGERLWLQADFSQASSQLRFSWHGPDEFQGSPFQVADARHRPVAAAKLVAQWSRDQGR